MAEPVAAPGVHRLVAQQLRAAVADPRLADDCLARVFEYMSTNPEFRRRAEAGEPILEPVLGWWRDHTGGRSAKFARELVPVIEASGPLAGKRLLDMGAGTGSSAVAFAAAGASVVAAETEWLSLRVGPKRAASLGVARRCSFVKIPYVEPVRGARLPFADGSFDVVALIGVLEHMHPAERLCCAREIERVLAPTGRVVVDDTPNRWHPFDCHTTRLWFVGAMPVAWARRWAVLRGRIGRNEDFQRRGATGVARSAIDALFPSARFELVHEKPAAQVVDEFGWLEHVVPTRSARLAKAIGRLLAASASGGFRLLAPMGVAASRFTSLHTLVYRRRAAP